MEHIRHGIKRIGTSILLLLLTLIVLPAGSAQAATKIKGIDVSRWQGKVDWKKVKASGVEFVMLGIGRYHNGVRVPDTEFTYNITNALANGIHVGVYLYSEAGDVKTAKKEAQFMLDMIDGYKISYPVAFDIEDDVHRKMTTKQRTDITIAFLEEIEKAGYYPMVYASQSWLEYSLDLTRLTRYDKWVARWASSTSFRPLSMWQYTNKGQIDGITGNVDLDYKIGNWTSAGYTPAPVTPVAPPEPVTPAAPTEPTTPAAAPTTAVKKTTVSNPKATTIKSLKKSGKKAVKITYKKVSGVSGYQIYMSTKKKSGYKKIATLSSKKSSYTKGKLKKGKKYYFKVRTMKKVSGKYRYSSFSKVRSIKR